MIASPTRRLSATALLAGWVTACGAAIQQAPTLPPELVFASEATTEAQYFAIRDALVTQTEQSEALRPRAVRYVIDKSSGHTASNDYDAVVADLAELTSLCSPDGLSDCLPAEARPLLLWLYTESNKKGDEPRILASIALLLHMSSPQQSELRTEYDEVIAWGRSARAGGTPFDTGLLEVWSEHGRLSPARAVLLSLTTLFREEASRAGAARQGELDAEGSYRLAMYLQRLPLELASIYLAAADISGAADALEALPEAGSLRRQLLTGLRAIQNGNRPAEPILGLAESFEQIERPDVSQSLCRLGQRMAPSDPRITLCIARGAASADRPAEAAHFYEMSARLASDNSSIYTEIVREFVGIIDKQVQSGDTETAKVLVTTLRAVRELQTGPVLLVDSETRSAADLDDIISRLLLRVGDVVGAKERLESATTAHPKRTTLIELGTLQLRTGDPQSAVRTLRQALDFTSSQPLTSLERAKLLVDLGDAYRFATQHEAATRMYNECKTELLRAPDQATSPDGHLLLGAVAARQGSSSELLAHYRSILPVANHEVLAAMLAQLVSAQTAEPTLALEILHAAEQSSDVDAEWRVYFAWWTRAIFTRAQVAAPVELLAIFDRYSLGTEWYRTLAGLGSQSNPRTLQQALERAKNPGQRSEAHFYAALAALERDATSQDVDINLRQTLTFNITEFFEHTLARELLLQRAAH